jgi:O-antigen/teichoic acid export membrane protein
MASQVPKLAGILALPIITRDLTDFDYGVYGIIIAYTSAIEVLYTLGLRVSFMNTFYKSGKRFKIYWGHLYGFLTTWTLPYCFLQFSLIYIILPVGVPNPVLTALLSVGASLFFGPISLVGGLYYQLNEKPSVVGSIGAAGGVLTVLLNILFISYMNLGFMGWFWSALVSGIITNSLYFYLITFRLKILPRIPFNGRFIGKSLSLSIPTIPHFYSMFLLNSSDRIVLNQFNTPTGDIGKYNVAYTVGNIFQSIAMASGFAITPLMMRCYQQNDEQTARGLVFFLQGTFLLSTFVACIWMKEIFYVLVRNDSLNKMYYLGIIIVMAFNYRPIYYGAVNKLIYLEKTKVLWRLSFIPGIVNILLNIVGIPFFGFEFAAVSTFVTFTLMGLIGYAQHDFVANAKIRYYAVGWAFLNVALTTIAFAIRDVNVLTKVAVTVIIISFTLIMVNQFRKLGARIGVL